MFSFYNSVLLNLTSCSYFLAEEQINSILKKQMISAFPTLCVSWRWSWSQQRNHILTQKKISEIKKSNLWWGTNVKKTQQVRVRSKRLASYCKADTTFTFHFPILTLSSAILSINNREIKSESGFSFAMASKPFWARFKLLHGVKCFALCVKQFFLFQLENTWLNFLSWQISGTQWGFNHISKVLLCFLYQTSFAGSSIVWFVILLNWKENRLLFAKPVTTIGTRERRNCIQLSQKKKIEGYNKNKKIKPSNVLVRAVSISLLEDKCGFWG